MRPRRDPVPRAREAWWWLGGLLTLGLVGGGVVAAGVALWENIDIRQLAPALQAPPPPLPAPSLPTAPARTAAGFRAVLFDSPRNASYFQDSTFYGAQIRRWRALTGAAGGTVRVVSDMEGLRSVATDELLLLPEAPCLAPAELDVVMRHLSRGGSVVTNWALGVRDGTCAWRGWQALLDVTGAEAIREITDRQALFLTVPAGLPTSAGVDPGTRIELRPDPTIALRMPGERIYWSDWALNPAPDREGAGADVAVATTTNRAGGRIAWFGVRMGQAATAADGARLDRVLQNGIRWAGGAPQAAPAPWPGAARSALVFALDVEGRDPRVNARDAAAMFELEKLPVSFFVVSRLVEDDGELSRALIRAGEVGTQTVDHTPLAGLTPQDQAVRLRRSYADIERWTDVPPEGLRAPEEAVDSVTLDAWLRAGGRYVVAGNEARSAAPEIHGTELGPMVLLPRQVKDDYTVVVRDVTLRSQRLADAFLAGTRKIQAIGGLAVVAGHTQIIAAGPRLDALRTVADSARAQGSWWMAEARDVADWWLRRSQVGLAWAPGRAGSDGSASVGSSASDVSGPVGSPWLTDALDEDLLVSFAGEGRIDDLWVDVVAPTLAPAAVPLVDGRSVDFIAEPWGMRVDVGTVGTDRVRRVSFVMLPEGETQE